MILVQHHDHEQIAVYVLAIMLTIASSSDPCDKMRWYNCGPASGSVLSCVRASSLTCSHRGSSLLPNCFKKATHSARVSHRSGDAYVSRGRFDRQLFVSISMSLLLSKEPSCNVLDLRTFSVLPIVRVLSCRVVVGGCFIVGLSSNADATIRDFNPLKEKHSRLDSSTEQ